MNEILLHLIKFPEQPVSYAAVCEALYQICDNVHSECHDGCPVYACQTEAEQHSDDCSCFKNGAAMYEYIKEHARIDFSI